MLEVTESAGDARLARLRGLQSTYRQALPRRVADLQTAWDALGDAPADERWHLEMRRLAHSLAGSAGTFGFKQLGALAYELECQLDEPMAKDAPAGREAVTGLLDRLARLASAEPDSMPRSRVVKPVAPESERADKTVYLVEDDRVLGSEIVRQLGNFGYKAELFGDVIDAGHAMQRRTPDALVLDVQLREGELAGPQFAELSRLTRSHAPPVLFISGGNGWDARLAAARAGGVAYLNKPLDMAMLVDCLDRATGQGKAGPYRVLIVDDTELLAHNYAEVLELAGMETQVLTAPERLLDAIVAFKPELILMDLYMPGCTGAEAAQVIRQDPANLDVPIVYLSGETDVDQQIAAMRAGGDDFLLKPISDAHLLAAVGIRVERFRALAAQMSRDSLTGLLNHVSLKMALESELERARRGGGATTFAMIDVDHFKSVNDRYGHPAGDSVLKSLSRLLVQRFRKADIIGRYGGEEFAVVLRDTDTGAALAVIEEVRERFAAITHHYCGASFNLSFSAGIAQSPPNYDATDLIGAADQALYEAKQGGRNRVQVSADAR